MPHACCLMPIPNTIPTMPTPSPTPSPTPKRDLPAARPRDDGPLFTAADLRAVKPLEAPKSFLDQAAAYGVEFEENDVSRLGRFLAMLLHANTRTNLTGITEPGEAWSRHIFDSLTLLPVIAEAPEGATLVDVGTGGGLPGIVLAIVSPALKVTLLEATGKKVEFLRAAVEALDLKNVEVVSGRAETFGHDRGEKVPVGGRTERRGARRESYDIVAARAVGRVAMLAELTVPLAKVGGRVLLVKGEQAAEELVEAAPALHLLKAVHSGTIETPTGRIVVLEKGASTPRDYPRADGEPKRAPLGVKRP